MTAYATRVVKQDILVVFARSGDPTVVAIVLTLCLVVSLCTMITDFVASMNQVIMELSNSNVVVHCRL